MVYQEEQWDMESLSNCLWSPNWQKWNWRSHTPDSPTDLGFLRTGLTVESKTTNAGERDEEEEEGGTREWEKRWMNRSISVSAQVLKCVRLFAIPWYCSMPGSSAHGIFQARILEQVVIPFSRASSWPRDWTCISCIGRWILHHSHLGSPLRVLLWDESSFVSVLNSSDLQLPSQ